MSWIKILQPMGIEQFTVEYGGRSDEELLLLAASFDQLTPEAQDALQLLLRQRRLHIQRQDDAPAYEESRKPGQSPTVRHPRRDTLAWQSVWFLLHLAVVYALAIYVTSRLSYWTRDVLWLLAPAYTSSRFEFLYSHLFVFSFLPALACGLLDARFRHGSGKYVWMVPTAVLAYKMMSFPGVTSVLIAHSSAFHQYFGSGFHIPEFHDWREFWRVVVPNPDFQRGMAQVEFTAPFYAGVGYCTGMWISVRSGLAELIAHQFLRLQQRQLPTT